MYAADGKKYLDLIAGISVSNVGHSHPAVVKVVKKQAEKYMHLLVYGEFVESPQVRYAKRLAQFLPEKLNNVYFTNSGTEATEGAMKLAKRFTGRTQIISFKNAYHGSTQGALSVMGDESFKRKFRPLLPGTLQLEFNKGKELEKISEKTAAVITETIQAESGGQRGAVTLGEVSRAAGVVRESAGKLVDAAAERKALAVRISRLGDRLEQEARKAGTVAEAITAGISAQTDAAGDMKISAARLLEASERLAALVATFRT